MNLGEGEMLVVTNDILSSFLEISLDSLGDVGVS